MVVLGGGEGAVSHKRGTPVDHFWASEIKEEKLNGRENWSRVGHAAFMERFGGRGAARLRASGLQGHLGR